MRNSVRQLRRSLILGLVLMVGALALWISACLFSVVAWEAVDGPRRWESLQVRDNAAIIINQYDQVNRKANLTFRGLAGQPLVEFKGKPAYSVELQADSRSNDLDPSWFYRIRGFHDGNNPNNNWYLIHDGRPNGTAYFVGYSSLSNQIIGYLGVQGYRPELPPAAERFAVDPQLLAAGNAFAGRSPSIGQVPTETGASAIPLYLLANGSVYEVNFDSRFVSLVKGDERILSIGSILEDHKIEVEGEPTFIARQRSIFRTETAFVFPVLPSEAFEPREPITIPVELRNDNLTFYACRGPENILQRNHLGDSLQPELFWIDSAGTINRRADVKLLNHRRPTGSDAHWWAATLLPSTVLTLLAECVYFPLESSVELNYPTKLRNALKLGWPPLLTVTVLCIALSAWVYRRQRRFAAPGAAAWAILVFLFGPFGLAGYWLHRNWPARERCPSCGQIVPHDRERCAACAVQFPAPARLGIEIFA